MRFMKWRCFRWPWVTPNPSKPPQFFAFFVAFHVFVVSKHRDLIILFGVQLVASPSRWTTNRPWKGRGYVTWHVLNFGVPIHISGMAEARALKFCTKGDHIKSCQRDDKSPLNGAFFAHVTHICMRNCGLTKNSPLHSVKCDKQCHWRRTTDYRTYGARGHPR